MSDVPDRRNGARKPLFASASIRTANRGGLEAVVSNLSAEGACLIGLKFVGPIEPRLMVKLTGMESLGANVRWTQGSSVGVEFERPLYGPVVDHLIKRSGGDR